SVSSSRAARPRLRKRRVGQSWNSFRRWRGGARWARRKLKRAQRPVAEREEVELGRRGLHWGALDADISIPGLLAERDDVNMPDKLDALADEALAAHQAGKSREL